MTIIRTASIFSSKKLEFPHYFLDDVTEHGGIISINPRSGLEVWLAINKKIRILPVFIKNSG